MAPRFPLPSTAVDLASWQNPSVTNPSPFYRFPGYYQTTFPQLNPAYLQSLWHQGSWPQPAITTDQLQHQNQLQQQQRQMPKTVSFLVFLFKVI